MQERKIDTGEQTKWSTASEAPRVEELPVPLFPLSHSFLFPYLSSSTHLSEMLLSSALVACGLVLSSWAHPAPSCDQDLRAVACESSVCSGIGIDVLKEGGNAADAVSTILFRLTNHNTNNAQLIALQFCVGVIGMYHSGVGGGGFMLVRSSNGSYEFIDFREMAPAAAFETMYSSPLSNSNLSLFGGLASGVPGELRGLEHLHKNYAAKP